MSEARKFDPDAPPDVVSTAPRFVTPCLSCRRLMFSMTLLPVMLLCDRCEPDPVLRYVEPPK